MCHHESFRRLISKSKYFSFRGEITRRFPQRTFQNTSKKRNFANNIYNCYVSVLLTKGNKSILLFSYFLLYARFIHKLTRLA